MRKIIMMVSTLALASMLLVACGGQQTATSAPATEFPTVEQPTLEPTQATPMGTETTEGTSTPVGGIPVTGEEDPGRLSNELDYNVWNQSGDQIGEVDDMVIDLGNSMISYVVVGTGGFLDIGEKEILVPWDQLQLQTEGGDNTGGEQYAFILQADQQTFENAPDTDLNSVLPEQGQPANDWDADIRSYWENGSLPSVSGTPATDMTGTPETMNATPTAELNVTPVAGTAMPTESGMTMGQLQGVALASNLLGSDVRVGANGEVMNNNLTPGNTVGTSTPAVSTVEPVGTAMPTETTGTAMPAGTETPVGTGTLSTTGTENQVNTATIDDVIIDTNTGEVQYFVLSASFSDGDHLVPVPLSQFGWDANAGSYSLNVDSTMLNNAPYFQDDQYPDTSVSGWDSDYSAYWQ